MEFNEIDQDAVDTFLEIADLSISIHEQQKAALDYAIWNNLNGRTFITIACKLEEIQREKDLKKFKELYGDKEE